MKIELNQEELNRFLSSNEENIKELIRLHGEVARLETRLATATGQVQEFQNNTATLKLLTQVCAALSQGQKINAIKLVREATGCGLKEAKDVVEGNYPAPALVRY